ncbi:hypothetical protein HN681_03880 [archaeon]|jgi:hypothetical protein|nr:hypothetical protein [archaeon]MBT3464522.1 hypothetical protein [archaeon]MBT3730436.1 hypothetical protein [archaeon]MBT4670419.1 hypothetical protein [archaeon]MBT5030116.1 hypothetical protein [archaeon]
MKFPKLCILSGFAYEEGKKINLPWAIDSETTFLRQSGLYEKLLEIENIGGIDSDFDYRGPVKLIPGKIEGKKHYFLRVPLEAFQEGWGVQISETYREHLIEENLESITHRFS